MFRSDTLMFRYERMDIPIMLLNGCQIIVVLQWNEPTSYSRYSQTEPCSGVILFGGWDAHATG